MKKNYRSIINLKRKTRILKENKNEFYNKKKEKHLKLDENERKCHQNKRNP